jgi:UDP-glucose 4-epimerase
VSVVVTGASGFLGTAALRALRARALDVVAVSRRAVAERGAVRVADYSEAPQGTVLVHLAEGRDRQQVQAGGEAYEAGVLYQLEGLLRNAYRKVVYASSALVYGDHSPAPHTESDAPQPSDPYTRLKLRCEARVLEARGVVLRVSNVYGPGMAPNNVVSAVLAQASGGGPLQVLDDTPRRDFVWIDDVGEALARAVERAAGPAIINIGSGVGTSVGELARLTLRLTGHSERPVVSTRPSGTPSSVVLDVTAATAALGWGACTSLEEGLRHLLAQKKVPA